MISNKDIEFKLSNLKNYSSASLLNKEDLVDYQVIQSYGNTQLK